MHSRGTRGQWTPCSLKVWAGHEEGACQALCGLRLTLALFSSRSHLFSHWRPRSIRALVLFSRNRKQRENASGISSWEHIMAFFLFSQKLKPNWNLVETVTFLTPEENIWSFSKWVQCLKQCLLGAIINVVFLFKYMILSSEPMIYFCLSGLKLYSFRALELRHSRKRVGFEFQFLCFISWSFNLSTLKKFKAHGYFPEV